MAGGGLTSWVHPDTTAHPGSRTRNRRRQQHLVSPPPARIRRPAQQLADTLPGGECRMKVPRAAPKMASHVIMTAIPGEPGAGHSCCVWYQYRPLHSLRGRPVPTLCLTLAERQDLL